MSRALPPRPRLFQITWPILSEHLLHASVGLLFIWLTARVSDATAAAFGISNQIMMFFMIVFRLVGVGASVVITQYLGARDGVGAERISRASLAAAWWMGVIAAVIVALGARPLLELMDTPAELMNSAQPYLVILGVMLAFEALNTTMASVLRAYTFTRDTMRLMLCMHIVAVSIGLPLIFGWWGLPRAGLVGIGVAFIASRLAALGMYVWLWRRRLSIVPRAGDWWRVRRQSLGEILHIGLPGAGEQIAYRTSFTIILSFVAGMGALPLATHTYMLQITYFILLSSLAIGFGTEIVVGHHIGAGQLGDADRLVRKALRIGLMVAVSFALLVALCGRAVMGFFSDDPQIIDMGARLLWVVVLLEPGRTFNLVVINGLRATGDARFPVGCGVFSMYIVGVGLAWLLGVHMGWGLLGVWLAFAADEWTRGAMMYSRWRWLGWVKHARRAHRKVRAQRAVTLVQPDVVA
ncbi:MAG: MATE family efflux transporter [Rhodocyclaceae bacterium]